MDDLKKLVQQMNTELHWTGWYACRGGTIVWRKKEQEKQKKT